MGLERHASLVQRDPSAGVVRGPTRAHGWEGRTGCLGYLVKMFPRISETFVLDEVLALRRHGLPVRVYSLLHPTRDSRMHPEALALMESVRMLPAPCLRGLPAFLSGLRACLRADPVRTAAEILRFLVWPAPRSFRRLFRAMHLAVQIRADRVCHLHAAWAHTPASVARIANRLTGIPWSLGTHAKDIYLSRRSSLRKKILSARFTLACTQSHRDLLQEIGASEEGDLPPPPVALVHHGVDTDYFSPAWALQSPAAEPASQASALGPEGAGEAQSAPVILSVGRLVPKKGFDVLLEATALLRARGLDVRVEIVGEGPLRAALEDRIRLLGLNESVRLRGTLVREEVRDAYRNATCAAVASRIAPDSDRDGIPNTLAEAMACGLPVVATRLPGISELVVEGETGTLVPSDDRGAFADALEEILRDAELRRRLGRKGRERVCREFDARRWRERAAARFRSALGIEKVLYLTADRGVPVAGSKGASIHVRSVLRALGELGVATLVLTTRPGEGVGLPASCRVVGAGVGRTVERILRRLARLTRDPSLLEKDLRRLADNIPLYREARRLGRHWHPDLVYERYALFSFAGSLLARRLGVPHVLEVNAPLAREESLFRGLRATRLARRLEGWILRRADRIVVVSRALEAHARRLGVPTEKIVVVPNAIEPRLFHPGRNGSSVRSRLRLDGAFVAGFSGSLKRWHGIDCLVSTLPRVLREVPEAHLLIVGDGPCREELRALASRLHLEERVRFAGAVPHEEVGDYLAACDVLVAPYRALEEFYFSPLKVAEYMAVGRPVVASAVGDLPERLGEAQGAVLVPPGDEASLARELVSLARDEARRERLARAASAGSAWTWDDAVRRILAEGEAARRSLWGWSG